MSGCRMHLLSCLYFFLYSWKIVKKLYKMLIFYGPCNRWCLVAGWSNKRRRRRLRYVALRYVATSCLEVSWQHQPVLHLDNFRPQEPVRHLEISTVDYRSLCFSWTCLHYRGLCCTTGAELYLDVSCQQEPVLHMDVSRLQKPVLLLDCLYITEACAAPGLVYPTGAWAIPGRILTT